MTPDAVIFRYLQILSAARLDTVALCDVVCADADLLGRWLQLLQIPAERQTLQGAIDQLSDHELRAIANVQAWSVIPLNGNARLSLDLWVGVLRSAILAEEIAQELAPSLDTKGTRERVLLALSGVNLSHDRVLSDLNEFRGVSASLLEDAALELRIFAVVDGIETERDETLAAQLLAMSASDYQRLVDQVDQRVDEHIAQLGLVQDPDVDWPARIWLLQQFGVIASGLQTTERLDELGRVHQRISRNIFVDPPRLLVEETAGLLTPLDESIGINLPINSDRSQIARIVRETQTERLTERADLPVVDRQLLRWAGSGEVLVIARQASARKLLLLVNTDVDVEIDFAAELYATTLAAQVDRLLDLGADDVVSALDLYKQTEALRLRELVHEANNPLSIVRNYLHILELRLQDDEDLVEHLQLVASELQRASQIISRARDIPDNLDDRDDPVDAKFNPSSWLDDIAALHRGMATQLEVDLRAKIDPTERTVQGDRQAYTQLVVNLLKNAIEASGKGDRVELVLAAGAYRNRQLGAEIQIVDRAGGIPEQVVARIGTEQDSTKEGAGRGVGLKVAYDIAEKCGLQLDLTTNDRGTTFTLFMPWSGTEV